MSALWIMVGAGLLWLVYELDKHLKRVATIESRLAVLERLEAERVTNERSAK